MEDALHVKPLNKQLTSMWTLETRAYS